MNFNLNLIEEIKQGIQKQVKIKDDERIINLPNFNNIDLSKQEFETDFEDKKNDEDTKDLLKDLEFISIDGGNSDILVTNSFRLTFVKVGYVRFTKNRTIENKSYSGFLLTELSSKSNELELIIRVFDHDGIKNYSKETHKIKIQEYQQVPFAFSESINEIRRVFEFNLLIDLLEKNNSQIFLTDGSLYYPHQINKIKKINEIAKKRNHQVFGISKNSSLYTNNANHLTSLLFNASQKKCRWKIKVAESNFLPKINVYVMKLNKFAKLCFRVDAFDDDPKILYDISNYSAFLGYPYPLIIADKQNRVRNEEIKFLKTYFKSAIKNSELKGLEEFYQPHEFLDTIR